MELCQLDRAGGESAPAGDSSAVDDGVGKQGAELVNNAWPVDRRFVRDGGQIHSRAANFRVGPRRVPRIAAAYHRNPQTCGFGGSGVQAEGAGGCGRGAGWPAPKRQ